MAENKWVTGVKKNLKNKVIASFIGVKKKSYPFIRPFIGIITSFLSNRGPPCDHFFKLSTFPKRIHLPGDSSRDLLTPQSLEVRICFMRKHVCAG